MFVKQHRLPVDPLFRFVGTDSRRELAKAIDVAASTIHNWIESGGVPDLNADVAAIKLGVHPSAIWGDTWFCLADKPVAV